MGGTIGNFEYLGGGGAGLSTTMASSMPGAGPGQKTNLSDQGNKKVSAKEQLLAKQMEEYMARRDSGMPKPPQRL